MNLSSSPPRRREPLLPSLQEAMTLALPVLLPLGVLLLQALLWDAIAPFAWLAFLPAIVLSGWACGLRGGLLATLLSIGGAEWLLTLPSATVETGTGARVFAVLLFSGFAVAALLLIDRSRREQLRLHRAVLALHAAALGYPAVDVPPPWTPWRRDAALDLEVIDAVSSELAWRKASLAALPIPLATFAADGRCLFANPAFARLVDLPDDAVVGRNAFDAAQFPGTGLAQALRRLHERGPGGDVESLRLAGAAALRLQWIPAGASGVTVCSPESARPLAEPPYWSAPPTAAPARPSPVAAPAPTRSPVPVSIHGLRCLVVDDQELNRELLREILRLEGAQAECCASGQEALRAVAADPDAYDVVLMDLQMPGMDGYAAARAIRTVVDAGQLPILAITADGPGVPRARVREAGMQGLLHKPLEIEAMLALLAQAGAERKPPR